MRSLIWGVFAIVVLVNFGFYVFAFVVGKQWGQRIDMLRPGFEPGSLP